MRWVRLSLLDPPFLARAAGGGVPADDTFQVAWRANNLDGLNNSSLTLPYTYPDAGVITNLGSDGTTPPLVTNYSGPVSWRADGTNLLQSHDGSDYYMQNLMGTVGSALPTMAWVSGVRIFLNVNANYGIMGDHNSSFTALSRRTTDTRIIANFGGAYLFVAPTVIPTGQWSTVLYGVDSNGKGFIQIDGVRETDTSAPTQGVVRVWGGFGPSFTAGTIFEANRGAILIGDVSEALISQMVTWLEAEV